MQNQRNIKKIEESIRVRNKSLPQTILLHKLSENNVYMGEQHIHQHDDILPYKLNNLIQ